jgi:hypothetical protein
MTQLSALFCRAGIRSYLHGRVADRQGCDGRGWRAVSLPVRRPLATLARENGPSPVPYFVLLEVWLLGTAWSCRNTRRGDVRLLLTLAVPMVLVALVALLEAPDSSQAFGTHGATRVERAITQCHVLMQSLAMILVPWSEFSGFVHDDIAASTHLLSPGATLLCMLAVVALRALSIGLRRRTPLASRGTAFFFAEHALESTVLPLEFMFKRRCYLPLIGIAIAIVAILVRMRPRDVPAATVLGLVLTGLATLLCVRVRA